MDITSREKKSAAEFLICIFLSLLLVSDILASDSDDVLKSGTLRHLAIPYANFVTKDKSGLDIEFMQKFAAHLGVRYEIVPIGQWVLQQTFQQVLAWQNSSSPDILLAVNLSGKQLLQPSFLHEIDELLNNNGLNPKNLEFEVTESTAWRMRQKTHIV